MSPTETNTSSLPNPAALSFVNLPGRPHIEVAGKDRARFLHNFCTNDIKSLQPGQGCEAFFCNVKGRVLAHAALFALPESIWIETVPGAEEPILKHLDRYLITEDVTLQGHSEDWNELLIWGQNAVSVLATLGISASPHRYQVSQHSPLQVRTVDWVGELAWLVAGPQTEVAAFQKQLLAAQAHEAPHGVWETLRIAAGFPQYGLEVSEDHLAQEVGRTEVCISFRKGCYLGQEPIARIDALGHVNRQLCRLSFPEGAVVPPGTPLSNSDRSADVGTIASVAPLPRNHQTYALAWLKSQFAKPGSRLLCGECTGEVLPPFQLATKPQ